MSKRRVRRPIHNPSSNTPIYAVIGVAVVVSAYLLVVRPAQSPGSNTNSF